ncbi:hypothetical protein LY76DRAFT_301156 [Colletotrichum caudatum]|nr:hypothetical protein LY76DRAFT_301156 [Colletotrichum caudatum]
MGCRMGAWRSQCSPIGRSSFALSLPPLFHDPSSMPRHISYVSALLRPLGFSGSLLFFLCQFFPPCFCFFLPSIPLRFSFSGPFTDGLCSQSGPHPGLQPPSHQLLVADLSDVVLTPFDTCARLADLETHAPKRRDKGHMQAAAARAGLLGGGGPRRYTDIPRWMGP